MENKSEMNENRGRKDRKTSTRIYGTLAGICLVAFAILAMLAGRRYFNTRKAEEELKTLQENTVVVDTAEQEQEQIPETTETTEETEQESEFSPLPEDAAIPDKEIDFAQLVSEVNEHINAWIYIPGTLVDYPVLRHPTEESYYLNRNLDGSSGYPGCIYMDPVNAADFSDPNTVIYGHNMKDDSMFGSLHDYRDRKFFDEHRYMYIYTPEKTYVYEIFAAYEYSDIHLIYSFDLKNPEIYQTYLDQIFEIRDMSANIADDIEVTADNRIVTLSTCIGGKDTMRYLVQGVLIYEQEQ